MTLVERALNHPAAGAFGLEMPLATGPSSAFLAFALQAVSGAMDPDTQCPSTPYCDAWGRTSPSGGFQLCRVPASQAGEASMEYEIHSGDLLLWRSMLPRALDEAVVSDDGAVDGFALEDAAGADSIAHVVTISARGVLEREWRIAPRKKWFVCGGGVPAATEIARVDTSRIAVRTGYDDLLILDASAATPVRHFDLHALPVDPGESKWIVEWDVLPGGEFVAVRAGYRRYLGEFPHGPQGPRTGAREDFWMRYFVVDSDGKVLWSRSKHCLTVPDSLEQTPLEAAAERSFREERTQRIAARSDSRFEVMVGPEPSPLWLQVVNGSAGDVQVVVLGR